MRMWLECFSHSAKIFFDRCKADPKSLSCSYWQKHLHKIFCEPLPESFSGVWPYCCTRALAAIFCCSWFLSWFASAHKIRESWKVIWKGSLSMFSTSLPLRVGLFLSIDQVSCGFVWKQLGDSTIFLDYVFQKLLCPPGKDTFLHVQHDLVQLLKAVAFVACQVSEVNKMC